LTLEFAEFFFTQRSNHLKYKDKLQVSILPGAFFVKMEIPEFLMLYDRESLVYGKGLWDQADDAADG